ADVAGVPRLAERHHGDAGAEGVGAAAPARRQRHAADVQHLLQALVAGDLEAARYGDGEAAARGLGRRHRGYRPRARAVFEEPQHGPAADEDAAEEDELPHGLGHDSPKAGSIADRPRTSGGAILSAWGRWWTWAAFRWWSCAGRPASSATSRSRRCCARWRAS